MIVDGRKSETNVRGIINTKIQIMRKIAMILDAYHHQKMRLSNFAKGKGGRILMAVRTQNKTVEKIKIIKDRFGRVFFIIPSQKPFDCCGWVRYSAVR